MVSLLRCSVVFALLFSFIQSVFADDEDAGRRIEEIVVYGERVESTARHLSFDYRDGCRIPL